MALALYTDGGVIKKNPSTIGGTWAYRLVDRGDLRVIDEVSGILLPRTADTDKRGLMTSGGLVVTNNQTEMLALLMGLAAIPSSEPHVVICTDSQVTIERAFRSASWKNCPGWMLDLYKSIKQGLPFWKHYQPILLQGHPNKKELEDRIGSSGRPVSIHNVRCDEMCRERAQQYLVQWQKERLS